MPLRTLFLARLIGWYCLIFGITMLVKKDEMVGAVSELLREPPLILVTGIVVLAAGLALVLSHNIWSGGGVPVAVSVIGWLSLIKGLILITLPHDLLLAYYQGIHYEQLYYVFAAVTLVLGLYLVIGSLRMRSPLG
jgi:hypothetical protein